MTVLFRVDASAKIGTGHVMRCIALAQMMKEAGDEVMFLSSTITPSLKTRLSDEGLKSTKLAAAPYGGEDARETSRRAKDISATWIIVDGYGFDAAYQKILKEEGLHVLFIDDYGHADSYSADIVLNQNVSARDELYKKRDPNTRLLLGPQYVLLRREFRDAKEKRVVRTGPVKNILVTLGGADSQNMTAKVISALEKAEFSGDVTVIVGGSNTHLKELRRQAASTTLSLSIVTNVADMPARMAEADLAVSAAGTTSWELLFMGVPFLTGAFADNQITVSAALQEQGLAENAGWYPDLSEQEIANRLTRLINDAEWRSLHSKKGLETVDGDGVLRVREAMRGTSLTLRNATMDDARLLFAWANDPLTRQASFSPDPISWEEHRTWMTKKLRDPHCTILIALDRVDTPVGYVRFEPRDGQCVLSIAIAPEQRGKGWSKKVVTAGVHAYLRDHPKETIHAFVRPENAASVALFRSLRSHEESAETPPSPLTTRAALHFTLDRDTLDAWKT